MRLISHITQGGQHQKRECIFESVFSTARWSGRTSFLSRIQSVRPPKWPFIAFECVAFLKCLPKCIWKKVNLSNYTFSKVYLYKVYFSKLWYHTSVRADSTRSESPVQVINHFCAEKKFLFLKRRDRKESESCINHLAGKDLPLPKNFAPSLKIFPPL